MHIQRPMLVLVAIGTLAVLVLMGTGVASFPELGRTTAQVVNGLDPFSISEPSGRTFGLTSCTLVRKPQKCSSPDECPAVSSGGKIIPRTCYQGQCKSSPELKEQYAHLSRECTELNKLRNEAAHSAANWVEYSRAIVDTATEANSVKENVENVKDGAEYAKTAAQSYKRAREIYEQTQKLRTAAGAAGQTAFRAVNWGTAVSGYVFEKETNWVLKQVGELGSEVGQGYEALEQELDAKWQGCVSDAKRLRVTEKQLMGS